MKMSSNKIKLFDDLVHLNEDQTQQQNRWSTGMSGRSMGPQQLTLLDLLKKSGGNAQHPNNVSASGPDIYGSQMMVELLGDLHLKAVDVKAALMLAKSSPVLEGRGRAKGQIKTMIKKTGHIMKLVKSVADDIDNFKVDSP